MNSSEPLRVLLVDDDEDDYLITQDLLREVKDRGAFELEWASTYELGEERLRAREHDVYLVDYRLSGAATGIDLILGNRDDLAGPVILLTGQGDGEVDKAALAAGASDYLVKGDIDADRLWRSIRYSVERARSMELLRRSEERYAIAAQAATDGLWDWDLRRNVIVLSERWRETLGMESGQLESGGEKPCDPQEWFERVHSEDLDALMVAISVHLEGRSDLFECEYRIRHQDGTYRWMQARGLAVREDGKAHRMVGSQADVTDRKSAEERLRHDAYHDALTKLPNRTFFMERLERVIQRVQQMPQYLFAVLFIDVDRFKRVNDSLGHFVGDRLLMSIARRLEVCLRPGDTVARVGGDEFTVLLYDIRDIRDAVRVAERVERVLALPFKIAGRDIYTSASIGIALSTTGYERPEDVLRDADIAMYRAKSTGPGRHQLFDAVMHERAVELLQLETDLRQAVERQEFLLHYQPILDVETEKMIGVEALLRWDHPRLGRVQPTEFIALAEETGLIVPIGLWALREACRQGAEWIQDLPEDSEFVINVNLSRKQLQHTDLLTQVRAILEETGLPAKHLHLEITESLMLESPAGVSQVLDGLRNLGIELHIDDFGTGYSALGTLSEFPVETLKIDRSFVERLGPPGDVEGRELVRTIVSLARNLNMRVIAEGVETPEQLKQLEGLHCDAVQGFLLAEPMSAEDLRTHLAVLKARPGAGKARETR